MNPNRQRKPGVLRIAGGAAKGRKIAVPSGLSVRPPRESVRQAVFNIIGRSVESAKVLDLYAGCGSFGLESLSRGAASSHFVEKDRATAEFIEANIKSAGFEGACSVTVGDSLEHLRAIASGTRPGAFDLVFADPPYAASTGEKLSELAAGLNSGGLFREGSGIVVLHVETAFALPEILERLPGEKSLRAYGRNLICIARLRP